MFEVLSDKLNNVFRSLGKKGRLTEKDVDEALREVRLALLEADVNFKVARTFVSRIRERALEQDVLKSLSPGQQVVKITNEELTDILGGGIRNRFLCRLTASACGVPAIAGPGEATALGNVIVQAMAAGAIDSLEAGRTLVLQTETLERYEPDDAGTWERASEQFAEATGVGT